MIPRLQNAEQAVDQLGMDLLIQVRKRVFNAEDVHQLRAKRASNGSV
jgi:hypothetical protein